MATVRIQKGGFYFCLYLRSGGYKRGIGNARSARPARWQRPYISSILRIIGSGNAKLRPVISRNIRIRWRRWILADSGVSMSGHRVRKHILQTPYALKYSDSMGVMQFLAPARFRGPPACPFRGVWRGDPKFKLCIAQKCADTRGRLCYF